MTAHPSTTDAPRAVAASWNATLPFYYGWINVVVASIAMTATLPGRTHGLGLITEPLLASLNITALLFAQINLVACLIGALTCFPVGWLIDRYGVRPVLVGVVAALGLSVLAMSEARVATTLLLILVLVRGLGQSALSIASMAAIGKWFDRRLGMAMGLFAVLLTFGFIASVLAVGEAVVQIGWQSTWQFVGYVLLAFAPLFWLLARSTPESCGLAPDQPAIDAEQQAGIEESFTLWQAVATPAFWVVLLGACAFNFVWSGVTMFNESMLVERGLNREVAVEIMAILTGLGLLGNLAAGKFATRGGVLRLLGVGLLVLALALAVFPSIGGLAGARWYAAGIGLSGGIITVVFFAAWGHLFGRAQLGRIQGAAQFATVMASSFGPLFAADTMVRVGSYTPFFYAMAAIVGLLALTALAVPLPQSRLESQPTSLKSGVAGET